MILSIEKWKLTTNIACTEVRKQRFWRLRLVGSTSAQFTSNTQA
jgi:hypothetical protein